MEFAITSLALLACPVVMGAMMFFMMRGMKPAAKADDNPEKLAALRAEHRLLQGEVDRLRAVDDAATSTR